MKTINKYINERLILSKNKVKNIPFDSIKPSERDNQRTFDNLWGMLHYWNRMYDKFHLECVYGEDIVDFPIIYTTPDGDCYLTELYVEDRKELLSEYEKFIKQVESDKNESLKEENERLIT